MTKRETLAFALVISVAMPSVAACQVGPAGMERFVAVDSCQNLAVEGAQRANSGTPAIVACDFKQLVWLVALPAQQVGFETLKETGIPEDAAISLSQREKPQAEFVVIEEVAPESPGDTSDLRLTQVATKIEVPKVFSAHAQRVSLTVARASSGAFGVLLAIDRQP